MTTCPRCHRPLNEGNSPNLEECHAGDSDDDQQCELSAKIWRLKSHLNHAADTIREARFFLESRSPIAKREAIALLAGAEKDYRTIARSSHP